MSTSSSLSAAVAVRPTLDFRAVGPKSGGVAAVARGVALGLSEIGIEHDCVVTSTQAAAWRAELRDSASTRFIVSRSLLAADRGWQRRLRKVAPGALRRSRAVGWMRRARAASAGQGAVGRVSWQPFHRAYMAQEGVVTVHDLRVFADGMTSLMDQKVIRYNVEHAKAVVCSWPHPYDHLVSLFPEAATRTFMIKLPVLRDGTYVPRLRASGQAGPRLILPALVAPHKNHESLLRALPLIPAATLVCTGHGESAHEAWLKRLCLELGIANRVVWRGYVTDEELEREYRDADILVMPTRWEAASGPVLEAAARGLPFVASEIPPIRAQLNELKLDVPTFPWNDPRRLAECVSQVWDNYGRYASSLEPVSRFVRARTWAQTARDYVRVFAWAAGEGERPDDLRPEVPQ